jgi:hypothetical protein
VENVVYSPSHRELQLIRHRGNLLDDFKGPIPFGIELCFLMADFEVGCF